ncbi:MAG: tetratricopeptide repeat protein [Candidatus Sumerlaeota bacterium]
MSPFVRKLIPFLCASTLIAGWSYWQWSDTRAITFQNDDIFSLPSADLLEVDEQEIPNRADAFAKIAMLRGSRQIPPDHRGAVEYLGRALAIEPLRADLWLRLSRDFLFLRERDKARAALLRSDELDPVYPAQRMESAQMWALLNDKPHAIEVIKRVAKLDATARQDSIRTLLLMSIPSDESFSLIEGETLSKQEVTTLLPLLKTTDPIAMERLWQKIPAAYRDDPDFGNAAAVVFSNPIVFPVAEELWKKNSPAAKPFVLGADGPSLLLDNGNISRTPFDNNFYYGWQPFPRTTWVRSDWDGTLAADKDVATIRFGFSGTGAPTMQRDFEWLFYRFPLPVTTEPLFIGIDVLPDPPSDSICRLVVRADGVNYASAQSQWTVKDWQSLSVELPPAPRARMIELIFQRNRRGTGADNSSNVYMTGFTLEEGQQAPALGATP